MGTRADFYVGVGKDAKWMGSVAWDGYEWDEQPECPLMSATTEAAFLSALKDIAKERDDWTSAEQGWPWPWKTSNTTDYVYALDGGKVVANPDVADWPDMSDVQNVTLGKRSGLIVQFN